MYRKKMMKSMTSVLSDFLINIAAGWLGLCIFTPNFVHMPFLKSLAILLADLLLCILFLVGAIRMRKKVAEYEGVR